METIASFISLISMRRPAKKYLSIYLTSIVLLVIVAPALAESWVVESQDDWTAARGAADNVELTDGFAKPKADNASFQSVVKTFSKKRKLSSVVFEQSPVWDNWEAIDDVTPSGAGNAYVFLPVASGDYYFFATRTWPQMEYPEGLTRQKRTKFRQEWKKNHPRGYHAWHST
ncbi:MAG: hypothetical protein GY815_15475, partial [Gammaproteobacteria bacterium]|nr:hypothetical protein [Gammaproteobacteria bacterium]